MRRRTRGRGSGRGARGGGSTSSRNTSKSTSSNPVLGSTKGTTILTTFQRQSSPYIRQLRGGIGPTIKRAINSIINDNDIMNNNTFSGTVPRNGSLDHVEKVNGVHGKTNGEASDGYLHKKFKKVNNLEVPMEKKNGVVPILHNNTLTLIKGDEDKSSPPRHEKPDGLNGLASAIPSVYKPKFRLSTPKEPVEEVKQNEVVQRQHLVHEAQFPPNSHQMVHVENFRRDIEPVHPMHPAFMNHSTSSLAFLPQMISPGMLTNGNGGSHEKRVDRQSLDDRISKLILDNQSILATWPEHLNKRTKGSGGRYSLGARPGPHSFGTGFGGEPSRKDSLDFVMSSGSESSEMLGKLKNGQKLNGELRRSSSNVSQHFFYQERTDSVDAGCEDLSKNSDAFTVPKKRRRLSPGLGILSGGEVAEMPNSVTPLPKQNQTVPSAPNHRYPLQTPSEVDMTLRVSNCGTSGAKITIRTTGLMDQSMNVPLPSHQRSTTSSMHDESSNSSSTSSSKSLFSPDPRQNMIRIRKNSIFEMESSPSPVGAPAPVVPIRKRSTKVHHEEPPKIRKVVERLQSHLNAKTAALAAIAASNSPSPSSSIEGEKSQLLVALSSKPIITTAKHNHDLIKVPEPVNLATISNKSEQVDIPSTSSLLLQTTALNPKRPTFLALKPANGIVAKKRLGHLESILPSPETPRGAKNYNQMHINGNAYTYLGFKISTKSSYTCLFKPQPMFVPQETDPKLSMYSNWQPRPKDPNEEAKLKLSAYDSRVNFRKYGEPIFITSVGNNFDTLTINSPENAAPRFTLLDVCGDAMAYPNLGSSSRRVTAKISQYSEQYESSNQDVTFASFSGSSSSSPPPSPGTPELTIDETPLTERLSSNASPKPMMALAAEVQVDLPKSKLSPPITKHRVNETHVEASPRYRKKSIYFPPTTGYLSLPQDVTTSSCSESSSADELTSLPPVTNQSRDHLNGKGRSISLCIDSRKNETSLDMSKPLSLMVGGSKDRQRSQSVSLSSPSAILNNLDSARVKIMEGGFESNEAYTYVRGRGRGRYVCISCGIRCKKPSMLRKHLKTHTDLRPYMCKLCNFSFKTKGNLTKHQKSKSHLKKCIALGIDPNSFRSLEMIGPPSDSNDEGDSDDDEDENESDSFDDQEDDSHSTTTDKDNCNDKEKFEKEIALSLLDLSQLSRLSEKRDRVTSESNTNDSSSSLPATSRKMSSFSPPGILQSPSPRKTEAELEVPIDLSVKTTRVSSFESHPKFFGGIVKTMEIVGEAQPWEPEEEFLRNGYLNLTKVRNHVEAAAKLAEKPIAESVKIEVPESQTQPLAAVEDKPFQFEITKRRRVVSMCDAGGSHSRTPPRNSSLSLCLSSPPLVTTAPPSIPPAAKVSLPLSGAPLASRPMRLHQPWLSPQGTTPEMSQLTNGSNERKIPESAAPSSTKETKSSARTAVERMEEEIEMAIEESVPTPVSLPVSLAKSFGGNGLQIPPTTSNGTSNFQVFGGLLGLKPKAEFRQPSGAQLLDEGKAECNFCGKTFSRAGQLTLHMNVHYLERPFRCDPCGVSFRTKGHLIKHRRSSSHDCKVYLTEAWGVANEENPRPFKCADCKIAFRIHGHLAKHLRSKMHIMRMECLGKLPFGIYFEMEKSGLNLNEIDTTDCDMSLVSLQSVAQKIYGNEWREKLSAPIEDPV